jgi:hypothetical protein
VEGGKVQLAAGVTADRTTKIKAGELKLPVTIDGLDGLRDEARRTGRLNALSVLVAGLFFAGTMGLSQPSMTVLGLPLVSLIAFTASGVLATILLRDLWK